MKIKPPEDITGESLEEWNRIIKAVESLGREIKPADRSLLAIYCRTYSINRQVFEHVQKFGPVIKWSNGLPGNSPQYKTFIETTKILNTQLAALGCTPESRKFDVVKGAAEEEMEISY
jgi:P27 family predicted phage terminase small subunit